jgi:hypothetical protein
VPAAFALQDTGPHRERALKTSATFSTFERASGGRNRRRRFGSLSSLLHHPLRTLWAALTFVGAALVFVILVLPATALADRPSGPDEVWYYDANNGKSFILKVGHNRLFAIIGKNLDHAVQVYCWDLTAKDWAPVTGWTFGPSSKVLVDVDANNNCTGGKFPIRVEFDDGNFVNGPKLLIT